jgi:hypothetical protein
MTGTDVSVAADNSMTERVLDFRLGSSESRRAKHDHLSPNFRIGYTDWVQRGAWIGQ